MRHPHTLFGVLCIAVAGGWAYHASLGVPFLFDDERAIVADPPARHLRPAGQGPDAPVGDTTVAARPLLRFSFALNDALGGLDVHGYHLVNLLIHLCAALSLFGIVRRTLRLPSLRGRHARAAPWLALAAALLWVVHPLNTQAVIYLSQRAESLAALWMLLTLYAGLRAWSSPHPHRWEGVSVLACAAGMATKEIAAAAPLLVVLYDRTFIGGAAREWWLRRRGYYAALGTTWLLLAALLVASPRLQSTGLANPSLPDPFHYALTQGGVILHYLRLSVWPHPLAFDYGWPVASWQPRAAAAALAVIGLAGSTCWAVRRRHPLGFLGAWVFLILAPTSSLLPIKDVAFEHRMYAPLMALVTLGVLGAWALLRRLPSPAQQRGAALALLVPLTLGLGLATLARTQAYASPLALWRDTVATRPANARAHNNLGAALARAGQLEAAAAHFRRSLALDPAQADAHYNLAQLYLRQGRAAEAVPHLQQAVRLRPHDWEAFRQLRQAEGRGGAPDRFVQGTD